MDIIKQISIFVENQPGKLAEAAKLISDAGIDLRSLSLADTRDFGILRIIVNQPDRACTLLRENGWTFIVTSVIGVKVPDRPGGLTEVLDALNEAHVNVEYMYAFVNRKETRADVIFRVDDEECCLSMLRSRGIEILTPAEAYET